MDLPPPSAHLRREACARSPARPLLRGLFASGWNGVESLYRPSTAPNCVLDGTYSSSAEPFETSPAGVSECSRECSSIKT